MDTGKLTEKIADVTAEIMNVVMPIPLNLCKIRSFNAYRAEKFGYIPTAIDKLIMWRSKLHTHTEFEYSAKYNNISFSATMADKARCCRFKQIDYTEHPERWDTIEVYLTDEEEDLVYKEAKRIEFAAYDLIGLLSFLDEDISWIKPSDTGFWCTEAVATILYMVAWIKNLINVPADKLHPTKLDTLARYSLSKECKK